MKEIVVDGRTVKVIFEHYRVANILFAPRKGAPNPISMERYSKHKHDYIPYSRGGKTVVILYAGVKAREDVLAVGEALCSMSDTFSYAKGRAIALGRAIKKMKDVKVANTS